jgi:hypothetical protein
VEWPELLGYDSDVDAGLQGDGDDIVAAWLRGATPGALLTSARPLASRNHWRRFAVPDTTCHMSISLDGFVAGPDQSRDDPLGKRGRELHGWHIGDPRANDADKIANEWLMRPRGAYVMGRNIFGPIRGDWDEEWTGLTLDIAPVLLGSGERIFDGVESFGFEPADVLHSPLSTHIRYRRVS